MTSIEINPGATNASLTQAVSGATATQFYLTTTTVGDGNYVKVAWNWLAYAPIFETLISSFDGTQIDFSLSHTAPAWVPFQYNQSLITFTDPLHGNTLLMSGISE